MWLKHWVWMDLWCSSLIKTFWTLRTWMGELWLALASLTISSQTNFLQSDFPSYHLYWLVIHTLNVLSDVWGFVIPFNLMSSLLSMIMNGDKFTFGNVDFKLFDETICDGLLFMCFRFNRKYFEIFSWVLVYLSENFPFFYTIIDNREDILLV